MRRVLAAAEPIRSALWRKKWEATPMTVVDTLDQSALRHGTETESGRRRRGPISWNHGRSWSSASTFYLTWNRTWCDAEAIREGQPRRGGR